MSNVVWKRYKHNPRGRTVAHAFESTTETIARCGLNNTNGAVWMQTTEFDLKWIYSRCKKCVRLLEGKKPFIFRAEPSHKPPSSGPRVLPDPE